VVKLNRRDISTQHAFASKLARFLWHFIVHAGPPKSSLQTSAQMGMQMSKAACGFHYAQGDAFQQRSTAIMILLSLV